jgi:hypothetical protein
MVPNSMGYSIRNLLSDLKRMLTILQDQYWTQLKNSWARVHRDACTIVMDGKGAFLIFPDRRHSDWKTNLVGEWEKDLREDQGCHHLLKENSERKDIIGPYSNEYGRHIWATRQCFLLILESQMSATVEKYWRHIDQRWYGQAPTTMYIPILTGFRWGHCEPRPAIKTEKEFNISETQETEN